MVPVTITDLVLMHAILTLSTRVVSVVVAISVVFKVVVATRGTVLIVSAA